MTTEEFTTKFREMLDKVYDIVGMSSDWIIISADPDCEPDYGVDETGNLIIAGESTNLPVKDLIRIKYRAGEVWDGQDFYIALLFENDLKIYLHITDSTMPGEYMSLSYSGRKLDSWVGLESASKSVVHCLDYDWKDPFVVNDGTLIAYLGNEDEVCIRDGIKKIGYEAFDSANTKKVILSDTVEEIEKRAFCKSLIESIDLNKVRAIGDEAFYRCEGLSQIILPPTLEKTGKLVFYDSGIKELSQIDNHSNIDLESSILR